MRIKLNAVSLEWLHEKRIFFQGFRKNGYRLRPGEILHWFERSIVEPYISVFNGVFLSSMGSFSYTHSAVPIDFVIGRYCSIAWNVRFPGPRHPMELLTTAGFTLGSDVDMWQCFADDTGAGLMPRLPNPQRPGTVIGNDVWIGQDASIMRGLTIGNGAIIAASSVVTKNVPDFAIVGGNPARFIRWRFDDDVRAELAELKWWQYAPDVLRQIDLTDIRRSICGLRSLGVETPVWRPGAVDLRDMPRAELL